MEYIKNNVVTNKIVFVRADLNMPVIEGKLQNFTKIYSAVETLQKLIKNGAKVIIASHFSNSKQSTNILQEPLQRILGTKVHFCKHIVGPKRNTLIKQVNYGEIILLENLRFDAREVTNDMTFAMELMDCVNIYINEAFAVSHRCHASVVAAATIRRALIGQHHAQELKKIAEITKYKNTMAIVGGSKIDTKHNIVLKLLQHCKTVAVGGSMAFAVINNPQLKQQLEETAQQNNCKLILPTDFVNADGQVELTSNLTNSSQALDCGPQTIEAINKHLPNHDEVIFNGTLGKYEQEPFNKATAEVLQRIADLTSNNLIKSFVGGGDTLEMLRRHNLSSSMSFASVGGGAFLQKLINAAMPGELALLASYERYEQHKPNLNY